jgi:hypothetical protein
MDFSTVLVETSDFDGIDFKKLFETETKCSDYVMERVLNAAADVASAGGNELHAKAFRLLAALASFHLNGHAPEEFTPRFQMEGRRSHIPSDFKGAQTDILAGIVAEIDYAPLRARVADVVWCNCRKGDAAALAIEAYCETIGLRFNAELLGFRPAEDDDPAIDAISLLARAFIIAGRTVKRTLPRPPILVATFQRAYERAKTRKDYIPFVRIARLGIPPQLISRETAAADAEALASVPTSAYPIAVKAVWEFAAEQHQKIGNQDAKRRCLGEAAELNLKMRDRVVPSAMAQAHWTQCAIEDLRNAGGFAKRVEELRIELRDLQTRCLDEMGQFQTEIDLKDEILQTEEHFSGLLLSEALLDILAVSPMPTKAETFSDVEKIASQGFEPHRVCRRPFRLSYAAMADASSMA